MSDFISRSKSGQQYYLDGVESVVSKHPVFLEILPKVLQALYYEDILSDESILKWNMKLSASDSGSEIVSKMKPFVTWLEQSDSESESGCD